MAGRVNPDTWTPQVWSHRAVMDMQAHLDPVRMTQYADDWLRELDQVDTVFTQLCRAVDGHLDRSWRGQGADASAEAVRRYACRSLDGLSRCRSVAQRLTELSHAASELRCAITPPGEGDIADTRLQQALDQVRALYSAPAVAAGNAVDDIPPPPEPFGFDADADAAASKIGAGAPVGPATAAQQGAAGQPSGSPPPMTGAGVVPPVWPQQPTRPAPPEPLWHPLTHAAAVSSPAADGVHPNFDRTPSTPASPNPVPATPPTSSATPAAAPVRTAAPFAPLMGAYPGHLGRDEGAEHRVASYLISVGNADDLIGELPKVAPPVLGE